MNEKKFTPTQKQIKFSEVYLQYTKPRTNKEIAEKVGVDTSTIWRWFNNPGFLNWLNDLAKELLSKSLSKRYMVAIKEAEGGNFQFSKLLLEIQGEYTPRQKFETREDIKFEDKTKRGEEIRKELTEEIDLISSRIRSQIILSELKADLESELRAVNRAIKKGYKKCGESKELMEWN
ncbi:hypothetical protein ES703_27096 [subsurface metagenome]